MTDFISLLLPKYTLYQWEGRKKSSEIDFNGYYHLLVYNYNASGQECACNSENATSWTGTESGGNSYVGQEFEFKKCSGTRIQIMTIHENSLKVQILIGTFTENSHPSSILVSAEWNNINILCLKRPFTVTTTPSLTMTTKKSLGHIFSMLELILNSLFFVTDNYICHVTYHKYQQYQNFHQTNSKWRSNFKWRQHFNPEYCLFWKFSHRQQ